MKPNEIHEGHTYLVRVPAPVPGAPRHHANKRVTVVATNGRTVTVETQELVCTNIDDFPAAEQAHAMIKGRLRYELLPTRSEIRATDVLRAAAPPTSATPVEAVATSATSDVDEPALTAAG